MATFDIQPIIFDKTSYNFGGMTTVFYGMLRNSQVKANHALFSHVEILKNLTLIKKYE